MERGRKTVEDVRAQEKLEIQSIGSLGYIQRCPGVTQRQANPGVGWELVCPDGA